MIAAGGARLVVVADLAVRVSAPDGRTTTLRVDDHDGVLRVDVGDVGVLLASLPGSRVRGTAPKMVHQFLAGPGGRAGPVWDQPVEVSVGGRVLARRRDGRWTPTARLALPLGAVVVAAAGLVTVVLVRLRRLLGPPERP